jgi:endonuclease YncB( thermonuclease family)
MVFRPMLAAIAAAALVAATSIAHAEVLHGTVVRIHDGDTLTVLDRSRHPHRVRIAAIDAPEPGQAFGERSRRHLAALVLRRAVDVESTGSDRYGRLIGKVTVAGADVGMRQLRAGMGWHYRRFARDQSPVDRVAYAQAEGQARARGIGLWSDPHAIPPWEFRRLHPAGSGAVPAGSSGSRGQGRARGAAEGRVW